jgi:hypothetical protein
MDVVAAVVGGGLGAMGGLLWYDLGQGVSLQLALQRVAVAVSVGAFVLVTSMGPLLWLAGPDLWRLPASVAVTAFGVSAMVALLAGAAASGRYRSGRWFRIIEPAAIGLAVFAWIHLVRQAAVVSLLVGLGPRAVSSWLWSFPYTGLHLGQFGVGGLLIAAAPGIGFLSLRVRQWMGPRAVAPWTDLVAGLAILGCSYRLPAAVALGVLLVLGVTGRGTSVHVPMRMMALVLCLLPVDVSLQRGAVPGPGWLPTVRGDFATMDAYLHGPRHGYVVLDVGSHQTLYYEPRWVWAW